MQIKRIFTVAAIAATALVCTAPAAAQFNFGKAVNAVAKGVSAVTITDEQMAAYARESVDWMDKHNPVLPENDEYTKRLRRLTQGMTDADGIPLNFKVTTVH